MKMSFVWAGKCLDRLEQLFPACGTGQWPPAELISHALTSRYGGSAHPHMLAASGPESCSPNPPAGQHVGMMLGVMDVMPFPVSQPTLCVKPPWKVQDALRRQRDEREGDVMKPKGDDSCRSQPWDHAQHLLQVLQVAAPLHICIIANVLLLLLLFFSWLPWHLCRQGFPRKISAS